MLHNIIFHLRSPTVDVVHDEVTLSEVAVIRPRGDPEDPSVSQLSADHVAILQVPAVVTDRLAANPDVALGGVGAVHQTQGPGAGAGAASHGTWRIRVDVIGVLFTFKQGWKKGRV